MVKFEKGQFSLPWPRLGAIVGEEELDAVTKVLNESIENRKSLQGKAKVEEFERKFADYVGAKHAIAVSSCGTALVICSKVLGIREGDEVITTPNTHVSTATSVMELGGRPVFADIDPHTFNLDPVKVEEKVTPRTKAIYPVHYAGQPVDMDSIMDIAKRHSLSVVEDAAHATGAEYKGRRIGTIGHLTCFSFQTQKNMTTLGEGGMITTNHADLAEKTRRLRNFGVERFKGQKRYWEPWHYNIVDVATNFRMTEVQAAFGEVQLGKLDRMNELRRKKAHYLTQIFQNIKSTTPPYEDPDCKHVYHLYSILLDEEKAGISKGDFIQSLYQDYLIEPVVHYLPVYLFTLFKERGYRPGLCPVAENLFKKMLSLPLHPGYSERELDYMVEAIRATLRGA